MGPPLYLGISVYIFHDKKRGVITGRVLGALLHVKRKRVQLQASGEHRRRVLSGLSRRGPRALSLSLSLILYY